MKPFTAVFPGRILHYELQERDIPHEEFAGRIGMSPSRFNEIVNGKRSITLPLANSLERELGVSAMMWMNLQMLYERDTDTQE